MFLHQDTGQFEIVVAGDVAQLVVHIRVLIPLCSGFDDEFVLDSGHFEGVIRRGAPCHAGGGVDGGGVGAHQGDEGLDFRFRERVIDFAVKFYGAHFFLLGLLGGGGGVVLRGYGKGEAQKESHQ